MCRWEMPWEPNVTYLDDPTSVLGVITSQSQSRAPTVLHYFGQGCPGCKALQPKLKQVVRNNPDFTFHKVRT
jgi:thiol-disulfide isomerase/thioredoxin